MMRRLGPGSGMRHWTATTASACETRSQGVGEALAAWSGPAANALQAGHHPKMGMLSHSSSFARSFCSMTVSPACSTLPAHADGVRKSMRHFCMNQADEVGPGASALKEQHADTCRCDARALFQVCVFMLLSFNRTAAEFIQAMASQHPHTDISKGACTIFVGMLVRS